MKSYRETNKKIVSKTFRKAITIKQILDNDNEKIQKKFQIKNWKTIVLLRYLKKTGTKNRGYKKKYGVKGVFETMKNMKSIKKVCNN